MKNAIPYLAATLLGIFPFVSQGKDVDVKKASAKIDALVEQGLTKNNLKPNSNIDDATFVRRAYLDIAGRVPTIEEAENFQGSTYERKREQLITDLLESDGHVSHAYNFWADVLRINSGLGTGGQQAEAAYQLWLKQALEENKHYDEFVRELVSATGKIWDDGAVGYYIRDRGMPLDNMSNTVRVFLGTRLECAQCHNHPFDKWTQMDYFKMAAFSYGMDAARYDSTNRKALDKFQRDERTEMQKKAVSIEKFPMISNQSSLDKLVKDKKRYARYLESLDMTDKEFRAMAQKSIEAYDSYSHDYRMVRNTVNELYKPLRYVQTSVKEKTLKLPHDYQYDDAKPHDPVTAATMFGEEIDLENIDESTIEAYADWMTSKENPTFTKVIANRLWKRVFGLGVFEPIDELTDHTYVANPELLAYLEDLMRDLNYDMRKYQEVLYNTKTYQRKADNAELVMGAPYHFPGPALRRMTAEQIWDSIVALALPEADSYRPRIKKQLASVEQVRRIYYALEDRPEEDYITMVEELTDAIGQNMPKQEAVRDKMYKAREQEDEKLYQKLRNELNTLRREVSDLVEEIGYKNMGKKVDGEDLLAAMGMSEMSMKMDAQGMMADSGKSDLVLTKLPKVKEFDPPKELNRDQLKNWKRAQSSEMKVYQGLVSQMARASELESPARRGHFLREFGQSDREVIDNSSQYASVPQALNLLNGTIVEALTNKYAVFGRRLYEAESSEDKVNMIFQAMLTREPTEGEMKIALNEVEQHGEQGYEGLVWALLNTQQFLFVQ